VVYLPEILSSGLTAYGRRTGESKQFSTLMGRFKLASLKFGNSIFAKVLFDYIMQPAKLEANERSISLK
jgi:hypothetical protein